MKRFLSGVLLASVLAFPGCSTGLQVLSMDEGPAILGGIRMVGQTFASDHTTVGDMIMACLDAPLSFVMDVVIIPFSAINEIVEGGIDVKYPPEVKVKSIRYHGDRYRSSYEANRYDEASMITGKPKAEGEGTDEEAPDSESEDGGATTDEVEADVPPDEFPLEDMDGDLEDMDGDLDDMDGDLEDMDGDLEDMDSDLDDLDDMDGDFEDGDLEDGDLEDGDLEDGDMGDLEDGDMGDLEDGDLEDGDLEDGDLEDGDMGDLEDEADDPPAEDGGAGDPPMDEEEVDPMDEEDADPMDGDEGDVDPMDDEADIEMPAEDE